jgi:hypothetical protein
MTVRAGTAAGSFGGNGLAFGCCTGGRALVLIFIAETTT